jgi:hypothetical protein
MCFLKNHECTTECRAYRAEIDGCILVHTALLLSQHLAETLDKKTKAVKYPASPPAPEVR